MELLLETVAGRRGPGGAAVAGGWGAAIAGGWRAVPSICIITTSLLARTIIILMRKLGERLRSQENVSNLDVRLSQSPSRCARILECYVVEHLYS